MSGERGPPLVVVDGVRTPFLRAFRRALGVSAVELARTVIAEVLDRTGVDPGRLREVIVGCAGQPVDAMNLARVAALRAGVPAEVPAFTVHRNCASGIEAVAQAHQRVRGGERGFFLAAGAESMSAAPFQVPADGGEALLRLAGRRGPAWFAAAARLPFGRLLPRHTLRAALTDPVVGMLMGETAEVLARDFVIGREEQDAYALESQRRAARAREAGILAEEIAPLAIPPRYRSVEEQDDGIRPDLTAEGLQKLRPVFDRRFGTVTVGNACQITDGAGALLLADLDTAREEGLAILARVVDVVTVGCDPRRMGLGPALAIPRLLERCGLSVEEVGRFEINEAFAVQVLACLRAMAPEAPPRERLNVHGGAIAIGHPVGATGVRLVLTLARELARSGERWGVASLCVGGGQGAALLLERREEG